MKKKIIISITIFVLVFTALNIANAKANDPCFDGMCSISVNITTGKTTISRLSDAEIAFKLAQSAIDKMETNRRTVVPQSNTPTPSPTPFVFNPNTPVVLEAPPIYVPPQTTQVAGPTNNNIVVETRTAIVETITATALSIEVTPTAPTLKATTIELFDVIWVIKNQINHIKKEMAKILIRTKGKK
jgi:hypothetical protein